ncbi:MAG: hydroxyethylthiazole kinase, partial [Thalassospira sp.]|nr:hydroxyethylthiazole kinase [Thalassospira sp.]
LAIAPDQAFEATVAALGNFAVAGEIAANTANGPASFMTAFIDGLHRLDGATYAKNLRINVL